MPEVFQGTPAWYSGANKSVLRNFIDATNAQIQKPYQAYGKDRIAPLNERQGAARTIAQRSMENPAFSQMFDQGRQALGRSTGLNTSQTLNPYIQRATESPVVGIGDYMNPYQKNVVDNMSSLVNRNLRENILPGIEARMLSSGSRFGRGRQDLTERALRDANETIARESGNLLHRGYDQALQARMANQQANLQGGQALGSAQARDADQHSQAALGLGNLSNQYQTQNLRNADVMNQLGAQEQAAKQQELNTHYQDFQNQQDFPRRQLAFGSEMIRGLTPNTVSAFAPNAPITPFQPSPWSAGAGMVGAAQGFGGMQEDQRRRQQGYAHGGRVKGYAAGGNPLQDGVQDAMDNENIQALQGYAQDFQQPNVQPQNAAMARMGLGLMAHAQPTAISGPKGVTTNPEGGSLKAFGKAGLGALDEMNNQYNMMDTRTNSAARIHDVINRTRQWQQQQQLAREQLKANTAHQQGVLGLQRDRFNFDKEQASRPGAPEIIKDANGASYQAMIDPESGKIRAVPIEGMSSVNNKGLDKQYDKELKNTGERSLAAQEMLADYDIMESLASEVGPTGPIAGNVPDYVATLGGARGDVGARQTFQAASNRLLSSIMKTQKGAQSDADMAVLATTKPGTTKTKEANKLMIEHGKALAQRELEYDQFLLDAKEKGKPLAQAKREWKEYVNDHPLIRNDQSPSVLNNASPTMSQDQFQGKTMQDLTKEREMLLAEIQAKKQGNSSIAGM